MKKDAHHVLQEYTDTTLAYVEGTATFPQWATHYQTARDHGIEPLTLKHIFIQARKERDKRQNV